MGVGNLPIDDRDSRIENITFFFRSFPQWPIWHMLKHLHVSLSGSYRDPRRVSRFLRHFGFRQEYLPTLLIEPLKFFSVGFLVSPVSVTHTSVSVPPSVVLCVTYTAELSGQRR